MRSPKKSRPKKVKTKRVQPVISIVPRTIYDYWPDTDEEEDRKKKNYPEITDPFFWKTYETLKAYSLISIPRFENLWRSLQYIVDNKIPGDLIECGVFLGGAIAATAAFATHFGLTNRTLWLLDSFEGFPPGATEVDYTGNKVNFPKKPNFRHIVEKTLSLVDKGKNHYSFVPGFVEDTLSNLAVDKLALVRLDTDYYESTKLELQSLYPKLVRGGVLIVDDYGHFEGARRATDDYFRETKQPILLNRVDYTARVGVKI